MSKKHERRRRSYIQEANSKGSNYFGVLFDYDDRDDQLNVDPSFVKTFFGTSRKKAERFEDDKE
jgi:hypothetical protein